MIFDRPLTAEERRVSARRLSLFNFVNGISFVCVGENVMVLMAVRLGCPDAVSAAIGTMLYVGFAMLPLGRLAAARWGAAKSEGGAWMLRNGFALLVALAAAWGPSRPALVSATILLGAFGFYGCRAAACVLQGPLTGEVTLPEERSRLLGRLGMLFSSGMAIGLAGVVAALKRVETAGTLVAVICTGSVFGVWSSFFLSRVHETSALRDGARKPVADEIREVLSSGRMRRLVATCCCLNLAGMIVKPASLIVLKRGFGATDLQAMVFTAVSVFASGLGSWLTGPLGRRFGPRKEMIWSFSSIAALAAAWAVFPDASAVAPPAWACAGWSAAFFVLGLAWATMDNSIIHYYINATEPRLRVSASMVLFTAMGALAGAVGLSVSALLMHWVSSGGATSVPGPAALAAYRRYFAVVACLLLPLFPVVLRIVPLPEEARRNIRGGAAGHN